MRTLSAILTFIVIVCICTSTAEIPIYKCSIAFGTQCILKGISVTKENYNFKPVADDDKTITQIIISNSKIPVFGADICNTFPNLAHLEIQAADIQAIRPDAFDRCLNLASLKIVHQRVKKLDQNVFKNLKNLFYLSLDHLGLESIDEGTLDTLSSLYSLSLIGNKLYEFSVELIKNLKEVDQLWINSNEISDLDEVGLLTALPKLKEFYFNDNDLSCHRVQSILSALKERNVKGFYKTKERTRFYTVKIVDKIECLTEVQWSSVYYKKVAQQLTKDVNEIKTSMNRAFLMINKENYRLKQEIENLKQN